MSTNDLGVGVNELEARRGRRSRQVPPPRHPKVEPATAATEPAHPELTVPTVEPPPPTPPAEQTPPPPAAPTAQPPAVVTTLPTPDSSTLPTPAITLNDPAALIISPTTCNVASSVMARFAAARATAPSHTAVVLDALRAHADALPKLILNRRPGAAPTNDLFPWRAAPGATRGEGSQPLRFRPTAGELAVMDALVERCNTQLRELRPGTPATNRSEMVTAALDAYLP